MKERKKKDPCEPVDVSVAPELQDVPVSGRRQQGLTAETYSNVPEDKRPDNDRRSRITQFAKDLPLTPIELELLSSTTLSREEIIDEWARLRWQIATAMVNNRPQS